MSMWRWQITRRANIPPELREQFEFYGETLLTLASASEPDAHALGLVLADLSRKNREQITAWLRERRDIAARHDDRLEAVECAILFFVFVAVALDVFRLCIGR